MHQLKKSKGKPKSNGHSADPRSKDFKPLFLKGLPLDNRQFNAEGFKGKRNA
jgi:hypothetical protein